MKRLTIAFVGLSISLFGAVAFCQDAPGIPGEIVKELDSLAGTWNIEGKIGDKQQTGTYTCWWGRTAERKKVCLVGRFSYKTGNAPRIGMNLIGWNSSRQCIEDRGFDANGGNATLFWTVKSPTQYQGEFLMVENGREVRSKGVLVKKSPSELVIESMSETGEAARWVFRKVEAEGKRKGKS